MWLDKVGALMAQKVHDLVFVSAGTQGLDLTCSSSEGVMMMKEKGHHHHSGVRATDERDRACFQF